MSRVIDRTAVQTKELGPCECPGTPHSADTIRLRERLSYADQLHLADAYAQGSAEGMWTLFNLRVAGWNLTDGTKPLPLSRATWQNLDEATVGRIIELIGEVRDADSEELPNASSAPSPSS